MRKKPGDIAMRFGRTIDMDEMKAITLPYFQNEASGYFPATLFPIELENASWLTE